MLVVALLAVAAAQNFACSGNGIPYESDPFTGGCKCFQGFSGSDCSSFSPSFTINDGGGNPVLFQEFWLNSSASPLNTPSFFHTPYAPCMFESCVYSEGNEGSAHYMSTQVGRALFAFHRKVGNVDPVGYQLVYGAGATEMISALQWARAQLSSAPVTVAASAPFYGGYRAYATGIGMEKLSWNPSPPSSDHSILEFVTYPNNPDGVFRKPAFPGSFPAYDMAYFWPSLVNLTEGGAPKTESCMIFTLSKLTGYAGTRFGWALVKDPLLARQMQKYISLSHLHNSQDANARALLVINQLLNDDMRSGFFSWVRERLALRVQQMSDALPENIKSIGKLPFYSWLECEQGVDCGAIFRQIGITPYDNTHFGVSKEYVRLENVLAEPVWQEMIKRINTLKSD